MKPSHVFRLSLSLFSFTFTDQLLDMFTKTSDDRRVFQPLPPEIREKFLASHHQEYLSRTLVAVEVSLGFLWSDRGVDLGKQGSTVALYDYASGLKVGVQDTLLADEDVRGSVRLGHTLEAYLWLGIAEQRRILLQGLPIIPFPHLDQVFAPILFFPPSPAACNFELNPCTCEPDHSYCMFTDVPSCLT